jgi:hypothetical protein
MMMMMAGAPEQCSVERKCSSVGKMCGVDDRACQGDAIAQGLEITCENTNRTDITTASTSYVYCPPGGQQRDSNIVWILLSVSVLVAVAGAISILAIRRRLTKSAS